MWVFWLFSSVVLGGAGHLMLKMGLLRCPKGFSAALFPWVASAAALFFLSMLAWLPVLSSRPLGRAVPMAALTYVLVGFLSWAVLGERPTASQFLGTALVVAGVVVLAR